MFQRNRGEEWRSRGTGDIFKVAIRIKKHTQIDQLHEKRNPTKKIIMEGGDLWGTPNGVSGFMLPLCVGGAMLCTWVCVGFIMPVCLGGIVVDPRPCAFQRVA